MKSKLWLVSVASVLLAGCATQGTNTSSYAARVPSATDNEVVVDQPYSAVWDRLVKELSKSYYVINNIDKESRIINMSFSSVKPQDYIDCGTTTRTYTQSGNTETFKYDVASSSVYKAATPRQPSPAFFYYATVKRTTSLEGRSNVYLAPDESDKTKTRVAVNTRYILSVNIRGDVNQENLNGAVVFTSPINQEPPTVISFNTNKPVEHEFSGGGAKVTCFGNGRLEKEILGLIR